MSFPSREDLDRDQRNTCAVQRSTGGDCSSDPNLRRYDWQAAVGFVAPYNYQQGAQLYAQLGGRVDFLFGQINAASGLIPDQSVSQLRQDARVEYVASQAPYPDPNCN